MREHAEPLPLPEPVCVGARLATSHIRCLTEYMLRSNDTFFPQSKTSWMELGLPQGPSVTQGPCLTAGLQKQLEADVRPEFGAGRRTALRSAAQAAVIPVSSRHRPPRSLKHPARWPPASGLSRGTLSASLREKSLQHAPLCATLLLNASHCLLPRAPSTPDGGCALAPGPSPAFSLSLRCEAPVFLD